MGRGKGVLVPLTWFSWQRILKNQKSVAAPFDSSYSLETCRHDPPQPMFKVVQKQKGQAFLSCSVQDTP